MNEKPRKNFSKVWMKVSGHKIPGMFIYGQFYNLKGQMVHPFAWTYRFTLCTRKKNDNTNPVTKSRTLSVSSAKVIPLTRHPEFAPVAPVTTTTHT